MFGPAIPVCCDLTGEPGELKEWERKYPKRETSMKPCLPFWTGMAAPTQSTTLSHFYDACHAWSPMLPLLLYLLSYEKVGIKLYDLAMLPGHEPELRMLPAWTAVMDAIKKEGGSGEACKTTACESTAETAPATLPD